MKSSTQTITPRSEDYAKWYQDIVASAGLAEHSAVRGLMVIKPYGYAIWENIQKVLDAKFKETGTANAYFPLLMPESYLKKEAKHVEGFAPEVAMVTHAGGKKLDEPLAIRPTSEVIVNESFAKWIQSYRDLPLNINQWANVIRWELRPRLFLRSSEFLWQEGHTAHATRDEAEAKAREMLELYTKFTRDYLAMAVVTGEKSESEKFAGAETTLTVEAFMQDGKALQAGTSHFLGQNFAKAFDVKYLDTQGKEQYVWQTSWGMSTRLIGALVMAHSDDKGLVLPPKIAPLQVMIIPVNNDKKILDLAEKIDGELEEMGISHEIDAREGRPGPKYFDWEKKGVPLRIDIGPKEVHDGELTLARRDTEQKETIKISGMASRVQDTLNDIQAALLAKNEKLMAEGTMNAEDWEQLKSSIGKGFARGGWCGSRDCEDKVKTDLKGTIRCITSDGNTFNKCAVCGAPAKHSVIYARAY
mgnify:CR=1 FL=1